MERGHDEGWRDSSRRLPKRTAKRRQVGYCREGNMENASGEAFGYCIVCKLAGIWCWAGLYTRGRW